MNTGKSIPTQTFKRLPGYYLLLTKLEEQGVVHVSSKKIAGLLHLNDIVVRKDLAAVSESGGRPRMGFPVLDLMTCIGKYLGYNRMDEAVIIGAGQLGRALMSYDGFQEYGVKILAAFDKDENILGLEKGGKPVFSTTDLHKFCELQRVRIGIITVPAKEAQTACDLLISNHITAIWNFAPAHLIVPENVYVLNENMASSLSLISQYLEKEDEKNGD